MAEIEIQNVILTEIRKENGDQKYEFPYIDGLPKHLRPPCNVIWLCGWNKADNVYVGIKGKLVYKNEKNYGLYFFERNI